MKKLNIIFGLLIATGFLFEWLYFMVNSPVLQSKFMLFGLISIVIGMLGLWVNAVLPWLESRMLNTHDGQDL